MRTNTESSGGQPYASLPLVSIIVINYNYARFLEDAVASAMSQTYPNIECVIVDDFSTDNSLDVANDLQNKYPSLKTLFRKENGGQAAVCLDGLKASGGQFIHFLDADDAIHPEFIATHVAVHLSLRSAVGFSSCDMIYTQDSRILTTSEGNLGRFLASSAIKPAETRSLSDHPATRNLPLPPIPKDRIYSVPAWSRGWPWSATSAMVFRRRALEMFADPARSSAIRFSADSYFCYGINSITGSVLIDSPLAYYRLHGANAHSRGGPLDHVASYDRDVRLAKSVKVIDALLDYAVSDCDRFQRLFTSPQGYYHFIRFLSAQHPARKIRVRDIILANFTTFRRVFGPRLSISWIFGLRTKA